MPNILVLKRNSTTGIAPTTSQLVIGEVAVNTFDGRLYGKGNNGADFIYEIGGNYRNVVAPNWNDVGGFAATASFEFDQLVYGYTQGAIQSLTAWVRVPNWYLAGRQISLRADFYSPSIANNFNVQVTSTLIRKNTDAVTSLSNQQTVTSGDTLNSATANVLREIVFNLSDGTGKINGISVVAGSLIKIVLARIATTGTDDSADLRFIPDLSELQF